MNVTVVYNISDICQHKIDKTEDRFVNQRQRQMKHGSFLLPFGNETSHTISQIFRNYFVLYSLTRNLRKLSSVIIKSIIIIGCWITFQFPSKILNFQFALVLNFLTRDLISHRYNVLLITITALNNHSFPKFLSLSLSLSRRGTMNYQVP